MNDMWIVDISYEDDSLREVAPETGVRRTIYQVLEQLHKMPCELSVSFVRDEQMQQLNHLYRGKDESTDVLSFVQEESVEDFVWPEFLFLKESVPPAEIKVLGDVVISIDTLQRNAQSFSVDVDEELMRLIIHGLLHLLGSDHASNDASEPMLVQQEHILMKLLEDIR